MGASKRDCANSFMSLPHLISGACLSEPPELFSLQESTWNTTEKKSGRFSAHRGFFLRNFSLRDELYEPGKLKQRRVLKTS